MPGNLVRGPDSVSSETATRRFVTALQFLCSERSILPPRDTPLRLYPGQTEKKRSGALRTVVRRKVHCSPSSSSFKKNRASVRVIATCIHGLSRFFLLLFLPSVSVVSISLLYIYSGIKAKRRKKKEKAHSTPTNDSSNPSGARREALYSFSGSLGTTLREREPLLLLLFAGLFPSSSIASR